MTKQEVRLEIDKKIREGYLTFSLLLDLFSEDEEIPKEWESMFWIKPEPPEPIVMYMGLKGHKELDKIFIKLIETEKR